MTCRRERKTKKSHSETDSSEDKDISDGGTRSEDSNDGEDDRSTLHISAASSRRRRDRRGGQRKTTKATRQSSSAKVDDTAQDDTAQCDSEGDTMSRHHHGATASSLPSTYLTAKPENDAHGMHAAHVKRKRKRVEDTKTSMTTKDNVSSSVSEGRLHKKAKELQDMQVGISKLHASMMEAVYSDIVVPLFTLRWTKEDPLLDSKLESITGEKKNYYEKMWHLVHIHTWKCIKTALQSAIQRDDDENTERVIDGVLNILSNHPDSSVRLVCSQDVKGAVSPLKNSKQLRSEFYGKQKISVRHPAGSSTATHDTSSPKSSSLSVAESASLDSHSRSTALKEDATSSPWYAKDGVRLLLTHMLAKMKREETRHAKQQAEAEKKKRALNNTTTVSSIDPDSLAMRVVRARASQHYAPILPAIDKTTKWTKLKSKIESALAMSSAACAKQKKKTKTKNGADEEDKKHTTGTRSTEFGKYVKQVFIKPLMERIMHVEKQYIVKMERHEMASAWWQATMLAAENTERKQAIISLSQAASVRTEAKIRRVIVQWIISDMQSTITFARKSTTAIRSAKVACLLAPWSAMKSKWLAILARIRELVNNPGTLVASCNGRVPSHEKEQRKQDAKYKALTSSSMDSKVASATVREIAADVKRNKMVNAYHAMQCELSRSYLRRFVQRTNIYCDIPCHVVLPSWENLPLSANPRRTLVTSCEICLEIPMVWTRVENVEYPTEDIPMIEMGDIEGTSGTGRSTALLVAHSKMEFDLASVMMLEPSGRSWDIFANQVAIQRATRIIRNGRHDAISDGEFTVHVEATLKYVYDKCIRRTDVTMGFDRYNEWARLLDSMMDPQRTGHKIDQWFPAWSAHCDVPILCKMTIGNNKYADKNVWINIVRESRERQEWFRCYYDGISPYGQFVIDVNINYPDMEAPRGESITKSPSPAGWLKIAPICSAQIFGTPEMCKTVSGSHVRYNVDPFIGRSRHWVVQHAHINAAGIAAGLALSMIDIIAEYAIGPYASPLIAVLDPPL